MKIKHRLIPGMKESKLEEGIAYSSLIRGGLDFRLSLSPETIDLYQKRGETWAWEDLHSRAPDFRISRELRELEDVLNARGCLLKELPGTEIFFQEKSLAQKSGRNWSGFSRDLVIVPDRNLGWWLEVPGAAASLWAPQASVLTALVEAPELPPEIGGWLAGRGFGGVPDLPEVTSFDWIWWESVRFLDRLGPVSRKGENLLGVMKHVDPKGPSRKSVRGHANCQLVSKSQLITLAASVFQETGSVDSGWYGEVSRVRGPSAGGAFEIELWALVDRCEGLPAGLYRFDGKTKSFHRYEDNGFGKIWLERAGLAWGKEFGVPQVTLALAADLRKLPRKYLRLAIQISLLNAGVRLSELLAVAEGMSLSSCALGGGALRELGQILDVHPLVYGPLCELAIGGSDE